MTEQTEVRIAPPEQGRFGRSMYRMTIQAVSTHNRLMRTSMFHGLLVAIIAKGRDLIHEPESHAIAPRVSGPACLMAVITGVLGRIMQVIKFKQITMAFLAGRRLWTYHRFLIA
jgi:hypothetical protein